MLPSFLAALIRSQASWGVFFLGLRRKPTTSGKVIVTGLVEGQGPGCGCGRRKDGREDGLGWKSLTDGRVRPLHDHRVESRSRYGSGVAETASGEIEVLGSVLEPRERVRGL